MIIVPGTRAILVRSAPHAFECLPVAVCDERWYPGKRPGYARNHEHQKHRYDHDATRKYTTRRRRICRHIFRNDFAFAVFTNSRRWLNGLATKREVPECV